MAITRANKPKTGRLKKVLITIGLLFLVVIAGIGAYGYSIYQSAQDTVNSKMHEELDREPSSKRPFEVNIDEKDPLSFLLLGTDAREGQRGRSDTIIVTTVNPNDDSMKMLSIPRDTRTEIIGRGFHDKINHAYAFGGSEMAADTVENFLDIPIDYVVRVNMDGFVEMVDAVGGVTVDNAFSFSSGSYSFNEGPVTLDGDRALAYTRMRRNDPQGDFGRNIRQQQVVNAIISEGASFSSVTRVGDILEGLGNNVRTNLTFQDMTTLMMDYTSARRHTESLSIEGSGTRIDGIWYLEVPEEERLRVSGTLQEHLGLHESSDGAAASE